MPCSKSRISSTDPCAGISDDGCACAVASCKSAESAAASAAAAARSAKLAQDILKNCLTESTILEDGGLVFVEPEEEGTLGGIAIDEEWLADRLADTDGCVSSDAGNALVAGSDSKAYFPYDLGVM